MFCIKGCHLEKKTNDKRTKRSGKWKNYRLKTNEKKSITNDSKSFEQTWKTKSFFSEWTNLPRYLNEIMFLNVWKKTNEMGCSRTMKERNEKKILSCPFLIISLCLQFNLLNILLDIFNCKSFFLGLSEIWLNELVDVTK